MPFEIHLKAPLDAKIAELNLQPDGPGKDELLAALQEARDALESICVDHPEIFQSMHAQFPAGN